MDSSFIFAQKMKEKMKPVCAANENSVLETCKEKFQMLLE